MQSITQQFNQLSAQIVKKLNNREIRAIIGRSRLKFTYAEIVSYVQIIFEHSLTHQMFKKLYKEHKIKVDYSVFMKNLALFCRLYVYLFKLINDTLAIGPSQLLNIVDTTLIPEKEMKSIVQKDWKTGRVTTRKNNFTKEKIHICGSKGLVFMNRFKQIYFARLININESDQNILKDFTLYLKQLKGFLLADRGFSNKAVRQRLKEIKNHVFQKQSVCRLISPYHYKEKSTLTEKESKLYKRRWQIETLFQGLKHHYSEYRLNLKGNYQYSIKQAKFYATLIAYNLSALAK